MKGCFTNMLRTLLLTAVVFISVSVLAQKRKIPDTSAYIQQPDRIEIQIDDYDNEFTVINGEEDGLLVVKETSVRNQNGYGWVLYKLDTALQIEWTKLAVVPYAYTYRGWDYSEGDFFLLFASGQYKPEEFSIFRIDGEDGAIEETEVSTVFPIGLTHFEIIDNTVIFAGVANMRPAVLTIDLDEKKPRVLPGVYNGNSEIIDLYLNDEDAVFSVALLERMNNKRLSVNIKTYTTDNLMVQNNTIIPGEKRNLIDGAPTDFSSGFQYVAGAYSAKSTQYSRGLYLAKFMNGRQQFIKYYNYADLRNFFDYMGNNRKERVKERISRRKSKGKKNKFNYRVLVHEIIKQGDEHIMIGEAYYPRYSSYQTMVPYGTGLYDRNYNNVIGYKYTHAIVVSFDKNGNILWDQSFPIDDVFLYDLEELVTVNILKDRIELLYLEENTIRSKVIKGNEVLEGKSYTPVRLNSSEDEFAKKDPEVEGLEKWYDRTLYAYGEQEIEHRRENRGRSRREVFYVNKVRYNPNEHSN